MSSDRDVLKMLADARPPRLDPDPGTRPDPMRFTAHAQPTATRSGRRFMRHLVLAGVVPTVAVVAAGAVFLTVQSGAPAPGTAGRATDPAIVTTAGPVPQSARDLFLVAAERTASENATSGRYWVLTQEEGEVRQKGPASRPYDIVLRHRSEFWYAMRPSDETVLIGQSLGAAPLTAADEAAWRADGSPEQWTEQPPEDLPNAEPIVTSTKPGFRYYTSSRPSPRGGETPTDGYFLAGQMVSAAELAGLPTDPKALKRWLVHRFETNEILEPTDYTLFHAGKQLVFDLPVSPQVRAAAYRMLADVEGVTSLGEVTDHRGRAGIAVGYNRKGDGGNWGQTRLIIDPRTGQALAEESWNLGRGKSPAAASGELMRYTLVISTGFSDDTPPTAGAMPRG